MKNSKLSCSLKHLESFFFVCFLFSVAHLVAHLWLLQCRRPGLNFWVGKIPWRREGLPTPVFWLGEFHGLYNPWGHKKSDTTVTFTFTRFKTFISFHVRSFTMPFSLVLFMISLCRCPMISLIYLHLICVSNSLTFNQFHV